MRPSDLYFLLVPPPASLGAFLSQNDWVAPLVVAVSLTLLGAFVRVLNAWLAEVKEKGGWRSWRREGYELVEARERSRDTSARSAEGRRMIKLEAKQQRREFKRRATSWLDQLRLF